MTARLVKNLANLFGLSLFSIYIFLSMTYLNATPECNEVGNIFLMRLPGHLPAIFIYLAISTLLNFLTEFYLEKTKGTKGFLKIFIISVLTLVLIFLWTYIHLYGKCENR